MTRRTVHPFESKVDVEVLRLKEEVRRANDGVLDAYRMRNKVCNVDTVHVAERCRQGGMRGRLNSNAK
jgi:hypothetical protein